MSAHVLQIQALSLTNLNFKKKKVTTDYEIVEVQKQILLQLTQLQSTHGKILKELEKRNELEIEKLEIKERKLGSQSFTFNPNNLTDF